MRGGDVLRHDRARADERLLADLDRRGRGSRRRRCARRGGSSGPSISSWRRSVRPMKLSFVVTTHGAMNTSSSSVEYAVMYAPAWIFVSAPTVVSFSISEPRPSTTSSPTCDALAHAGLVAEDHARADRACRRRRSRPSRRSCRHRAPPAAAARASRSSAARASAACRRPRPRAPSRPRRAPCRDRRSPSDGSRRSDARAGERRLQRARARARPRARRALRARRCLAGDEPRKCEHSSRSGSSFGIFGLKMSPVRVRHSP